MIQAMDTTEQKIEGLGETVDMPNTFMGDLFKSILQPGYIGTSSVIIINVAFFFTFVAILWKILLQGFEDYESFAHIFALVSLIGLWISVDWFFMEMKTLRPRTTQQPSTSTHKKKKKKSKKKNKKKK